MELESIDHEPLNPPGKDPGLIVTLTGLGRTLLFDLGENGLPPGRLLEVSDLFVSHAHIDHFAGFDRLLRSLLGRTRTVRVYGPPGMTGHVKGKLDGYLWNLDFAELVTFEVHEVEPGGGCRRTRFSLRDRFGRGEPLPALPPSPVLLDEPFFSVRWAELDHGTPSLAYALVQRDRYSFSPEALVQAGHQPGPELGRLKQRILEGREPELAERLGRWVRGQRIAYVTDCELNRRTVRAALAVARDADVLYGEATYPDREEAKARQVHHLTGGQAGALARAAGVRHFVPGHFSRRYAADPAEILDDVAAGLAGATRWSALIEGWLAEGDSEERAG